MAQSYFAIRQDLLDRPYRSRLGPFQARLATDDEAIVYQRIGDEVSFLGTTSVASATTQPGEESDRQVVNFGVLHQFSEKRQLSVLAGSLKKVYKFLAPERHFRRAVVKISREDFTAISKNEIDINRSVYRYLFSALPIELRADFVRRNINQFALSPQGYITNYQRICPQLIQYYSTQIEDSFDLINLVVRQFGSMRGLAGLRPLADLILTDGRGQNGVQFGRVAEDISGFMERSPIFAERAGNPRLIDESAKQIALNDDPTGPTQTMRQREWNDPIF